MRPVLAVSGHTTIPAAPGTDLDSNHKAVLMAGGDAEDCLPASHAFAVGGAKAVAQTFGVRVEKPSGPNRTPS